MIAASWLCLLAPLAGALGILWSDMAHATFFALMAGVAATAGILLRSLDAAVIRAEVEPGTDSDHAMCDGQPQKTIQI